MSQEPKRRMVISMEGGLIQEIYTDFEMDIFILDEDFDEEDEKRSVVSITDEHGHTDKRYLSKWELEGDPRTTEFFVKQITDWKETNDLAKKCCGFKE